MKRIVLFISVIVFSISAFSQLRLDAGFGIGRGNVKYVERFTGLIFEPRNFEARLSASADARIGYEFSHGIGVYSGLRYDLIRSEGISDKMYSCLTQEYTQEPSRMLIFHFLTVPLMVEYRFVRDIVRPYFGCGASFYLGGPRNFVDDLPNIAHGAVVEYKRVAPSLLFGVNFEYRRFMFGVGMRRDVRPFLATVRRFDTDWKVRQLSFRVGWRVF